ncbi:Hypothetical_protein [Hexamita inflata]|uniref:Hypothetical_protein n=1 Tax=Hexamita inflata TaxID=28002 RepID=A0AA86PBY2_9EUKA|nr:Hypothetical protein HINF_LOCUS23630 [Hexamita inflata]
MVDEPLQCYVLFVNLTQYKPISFLVENVRSYHIPIFQYRIKYRNFRKLSFQSLKNFQNVLIYQKNQRFWNFQFFNKYSLLNSGRRNYFLGRIKIVLDETVPFSVQIAFFNYSQRIYQNVILKVKNQLLVEIVYTQNKCLSCSYPIDSGALLAIINSESNRE